jgi:hypothetical protein
MDAPPSLHPTDRILESYGLGKLDDASCHEVDEHLRGCDDCRRRVGALTPGTFVGRRSEAQQSAGKPFRDRRPRDANRVRVFP